jgi:antitoxin (DNA-binding transcriptional repressor) of toxin-antitoxin stability system
VIITRRGKPVVELRPAAPQTAPATGTHEWLRARTRARPGASDAVCPGPRILSREQMRVAPAAPGWRKNCPTIPSKLTTPARTLGT